MSEGVIVTDENLRDIELLRRGIDPCQVVVDEHPPDPDGEHVGFEELQRRLETGER